MGGVDVSIKDILGCRFLAGCSEPCKSHVGVANRLGAVWSGRSSNLRVSKKSGALI